MMCKPDECVFVDDAVDERDTPSVGELATVADPSADAVVVARSLSTRRTWRTSATPWVCATRARRRADGLGRRRAR
jgi:hypothetical protein